MAPRGRKRKRGPAVEVSNASNGESSPVEVPSKDDAENVQSQESSEDVDEEQAIWDTFKEEHHEAIEQLPLSLHRTFRLIQELDSKTQACQQQLQAVLRLYVDCRRNLRSSDDQKDISVEQLVDNDGTDENEQPQRDPAVSSPVLNPPISNILPDNLGPKACLDDQTRLDSRQLITRLATLVEEWVRTADEKVNLAQSAYNSTDRHVRILDIAIADQEKAVSRSLVASNPTDIPPRSAGDSEKQSVLKSIPENMARPTYRKAHLNVVSDLSIRKAPGRKKPEAPPNSSMSGTQTAIDMAILPNEPLYCYCNQVSHGSMIACDNKDCAREWFHYACVGLSEAPTDGKPWYCPDCSDALGRNGRRRR